MYCVLHALLHRSKHVTAEDSEDHMLTLRCTEMLRALNQGF